MSYEPDYAADRAAATDWAKRILNAGEAVILDTETTGLRSQAEICQIAVIDLQGSVLLDTLVKPWRGIPADATAIHGITDATVANARPFDAILPELRKAIQDRPVIIYNADYDLRLICQSAALCGLTVHGLDELGARTLECAMREYAAYCGEWSDHWANYRYQKLPGGDHSALGDCRATLRVIERMAGVANTPITVLLREEDVERWFYGRGLPLAEVLAAFAHNLVDIGGVDGEVANAWLTLHRYSLPEGHRARPRLAMRQRPKVVWEAIPEESQ